MVEKDNRVIATNEILSGIKVRLIVDELIRSTNQRKLMWSIAHPFY